MARAKPNSNSLGACRAAILAALMVLDGHAPPARVVFGKPKPSFQQLADSVKAVPTQRSYRNSDTVHPRHRRTYMPWGHIGEGIGKASKRTHGMSPWTRRMCLALRCGHVSQAQTLAAEVMRNPRGKRAG
jgi:hypothetical protein